MTHTLCGDVAREVNFHADQGAQYTSGWLYRGAEELGLVQPVGQTGMCGDYAMSESFWSTSKTEFFDRRVWASRAAARRESGRRIEEVYNRRPLHSALGRVPQAKFEQGPPRDGLVSDGEEEMSTQAS